MKIKRFIIRILYTISFIISIVLIYCSYQKSDFNTISASLAVIAAIISAWIATKTFEVQEDSMKPDVEIKLDIYSTIFMPQLIISNIGKEIAKDIDIKYDDKFLKKFSKYDWIKSISSLGNNEQLHQSLGGHVHAFDQDDKQEYQFVINFKDSGKRKYKKEIFIDFSKYKGSNIYPTDEYKAMYYLSKFFEKNSNSDISLNLNKIKDAIDNLKENENNIEK